MYLKNIFKHLILINKKVIIELIILNRKKIMKKNNQKGFTLIELLVVVAIIGILASVGVVAYNGYTSSAQRSASASNHNSVAKWVANEYQKCAIGDATAMGGALTCVNEGTPATVAEVVTATITSQTAATAKMDNPYTKVAAVQDPGAAQTSASCAAATVGQINVVAQEADPDAEPPVPAAVIVSSCPDAAAANFMIDIVALN